ncbi:MAG TPA: hypothetical protein VMU32_00005 [Solirubrobacteraceae bacterium]|nr:hypothetical protein [Solirubrobacteraceae bacterium]
MSRSKMTVAGLIAALICSVAFVASASAATAGWMVNGKLLAANETKNIALGTVVDESFILHVPLAGLEITCKGLNIQGGMIIGTNKNLEKSLAFTECTAGNGNCSIGQKEIATVPLSSEATLDSENTLAVNISFTPETGTIFATIKFEGSTCALLGVKAVTGSASALAPTGQDEKQVQLLSSTSKSLKVGTDAAEITGSALLELESKETWSFL